MSDGFSDYLVFVPGIAPDGDGCEFGKVLGAMKAEEK